MVAADEEKEEEEEEVVAEPTSVEVDNQPRNGGDVKEKEKAVEESEASEGEEEKSSSDVIDSPPTSSVVSDNSGVEESGEDKEGIDEEVKRTTSVDFFDQILGEVDEKPASEPKQEEEDMTPKRDIPEAPPMMLRTPSPPTIPAPTLPLMLPKTPESSEEGNKEGAAEAAAVVTDGGYSSDGGHASSTPRAAESASIAPTKAPWRGGAKASLIHNSVGSDVLLPPSATGSNSPDTGSRGDLSSSRPPPSPVHSTRDSFDRTYRARIADHSKRIQYIEEKMCDHGNAFEEFIKKNSDMMMEMKDNIKELRDEVDGQQKSVNEELRGKIEEQRKQLVEVNEAKEKQEEVLNELRKQVAELSSTVAAAKMANEVDDDTLMKDLPDFIRTRDREDILAFVQNLLKAKKKQEAMYQSRMETGSVYSQRSRSVMQTRNAGGRGQQGGDSSSPASSISRIRRAGSSTNKWQSKRGNRSFMSGPSRSYPVRSFHRLMEEYDSDDDDAGRDDLICSPEGGADTAAASPTSDMDDSHLSEIHSSSALIARLDYLGNQCQYSVPSSTGREETEAARTTLEDGATSTDPAVASAFAKTMEVISFSWDSSALPRNPLLTKSTLFKAFSYMPAKLEELLKGSTRSPLSSGMQRQVRAMLGAMWNITLNEDSSENPILIQGSELLPSLVQVLARYSVDDRDICKNACGLLLTLMTNDSKLCRDFLAIDGGLSVLTSVLRTHKFEQEDAATEQALQCIFLLATVVPECRPTIASQIDRFTLDRLQGIRHASRLRDILYRSSSSSNSKSKFLAPPVPPRHQ
ncbi:hypothetical protein FOL47_006406 [Perkinsus chesapeaki]|uniref:Uncharacterized protein n=1 Tax=Perkinsus chesapeaki TaxID=330153 RepID=A0A7J6LSF1_PERCH|nr:hypothetical protein FOL47_006406 [Perkinsus chesapeaki]